MAGVRLTNFEGPIDVLYGSCPAYASYRAQVLNSNFTAFIDTFTSNTYVMVIMSDKSIQSAATRMIIAAARKHFERFIHESSSGMASVL